MADGQVQTYRKVIVGWGLFWLAAIGVAVLFWHLAQPAKSPARKQTAAAARTAAELQRLPARPEDLASQALAPVDADAARALNAAAPFADLHPAPARAFRFAGTPLDRARAVDCLALAAMAEAGSSDGGQRAVIQVILNRVRHPAFAKTVCGVVFQGSERSTGCQFTFTCDGALARRYGEPFWAAARKRSAEALDGKVYAPVGAATHYHTDWVYPVWSSELDKIARVDTHLFFRWKGFWGSRDAARFAYRGGEPAIAQIAWLPSHAGALALASASASEAAGEQPVSGPRSGEQVGNALVVTRNPLGGIYLVHLQGAPTVASARALGRQICGGKGYCRVWGWLDAGAIPQSFPVPREARARLSFSYVFDTDNAEYVFYDCRAFPDAPADECLANRS